MTYAKIAGRHRCVECKHRSTDQGLHRPIRRLRSWSSTSLSACSNGTARALFWRLVKAGMLRSIEPTSGRHKPSIRCLNGWRC